METPLSWEKAANEVKVHLDCEIATDDSYERFMTQLADYLNQLIRKDFSRLLYFLYRIDVSEAKLRYMLNANKDKDAGVLIAELMMERELRKIQTRTSYKPGDCEEEKW